MSGDATHDEPRPRAVNEVGARLVLGIGAPLAPVAIAYVLWSLSDRLLSIGPLDRAAFGWAVVVPVWAIAPGAAAFAWRRLTPRDTAVAAAGVGLIVGGVASAMLWSALAYPTCEFGAIRSPIELAVPSVVVGLVIGAGLAASCLLAVSVIRRGHPWWAGVVGAGSGLALAFVAMLAATIVLLGAACQRPPLG